MNEILVNSAIAIFACSVLLALTGCWPVAQFKLYRKLRGGSWAKCTGLFWGKRWFRIGKFWHRDAQEYWD